jgi:class 3 adenylate cyclase
VSRACPSCGSDNGPSARFCATCGTPLARTCPRCGAEVADAARFCPTCGQSLASDVVPDERKIATVLFVDLVDSTALGDRLDPERVRAILQGYFSVVSSTVAAWGGSIEKYIGDAAVAVFGVPRVREDDAARAVSAAAEIGERIAALAAEPGERSDVRLAIRIGVNTGEVVAPAEIHPDRPLVTGDTVNVAARIEAAAQPGQILVGERTYLATRSIFDYEPQDPVRAKGKPEPVAVHRLVGRRASAAEAGPVRAVRGPLVGRERELAFIGAQIDAAIASGMPRLAVVYGEAGIGKSRVVREAIALAGSERANLTVLRGRCPAVDKGITYWPLVEILRAACGISLDDDASEAGAKLSGAVRGLLARGNVREDDVEASIFALATTAGIPMRDNPLDSARPLAVRSELARRWPAFASALAARGPAVLVVEDLHWANALLVEMLERILDRAVGPVVVVATARPEFAEAETTLNVGRQEAASMSLRPLDAAQGSALLDALLPERRLPPETETAILATAEGNPLFVEEIVARLVETGAIVRDDGRWEVAQDTVSLAIPDTIHGVLAARIDGLPELERRVLREAAVIGRVFWDRPLGLALGSADVGEPLDTLERRGLVVLRPASTLSGEAEYAFKHALVRDVAYAGLTLARRAAAHAATATWLATVSPERPEELAELIAYHWERALGDGADLAWSDGSPELADVRRRAMLGFRVAADTARKRYDLKRAIELQERAIELAVTPDDRAAALEELGNIHDTAYDGDHARAAWEEAIAIVRTLPDGPHAVSRMRMNLARMAAIMWGSFSTPVEPDVIDGYVDEGRAGDPDARTLAWLEMLKAAAGVRWIAFHRPDPVPAAERVRALDAAYDWAERHGDARLLSNVLHNRRALLIANGDVDGAVAAARRQLETAGSIGDPRERHLGMIEAACTLTWVAGEAAAMVELLRASLLLGRELRPHDVNHSTMNLIAALSLSGRWDDIPPVIDEHVRAFDEQPDGSCPFAMSAFPLAAIFHARRGAAEKGRELLAKKTPESEWPVGMAEALRAKATLELGDAGAARDEARRVLDTGQRNYAEEPAIELLVLADALVALEDWDGVRASLPELRARQGLVAAARATVDRAEASARAAAGDRASAIGLLEAAVRDFDRLDPYEAARTRERLATLTDRAAERDELLAAALATYQRLGALPDMRRLAAAAG